MGDCPVFQPDHNGECLNCDNWSAEHTPEAIAAGEALAARPHAKLAADCWGLINALRDPRSGKKMLPRDDAFELAARNLIEMACDSAAESERLRLGRRPKGA